MAVDAAAAGMARGQARRGRSHRLDVALRDALEGKETWLEQHWWHSSEDHPQELSNITTKCEERCQLASGNCWRQTTVHLHQQSKVLWNVVVGVPRSSLPKTAKQQLYRRTNER